MKNKEWILDKIDDYLHSKGWGKLNREGNLLGEMLDVLSLMNSNPTVISRDTHRHYTLVWYDSGDGWAYAQMESHNENCESDWYSDDWRDWLKEYNTPTKQLVVTKLNGLSESQLKEVLNFIGSME